MRDDAIACAEVAEAAAKRNMDVDRVGCGAVVRQRVQDFLITGGIQFLFPGRGGGVAGITRPRHGIAGQEGFKDSRVGCALPA